MPKHKRLTEQERKTIVERYVRGDKVDSIAVAYRTTPKRIRAFVRSAGHPIRSPGRGPGMPADLVSEAGRLYLELGSIRDVAKALGRSLESTRQWVVASGVRRRPSSARLKEERRVDAPPPAVDLGPVRPAVLVPTRIIARNPFGFDVEHANPMITRAEKEPYERGVYPKSAGHERSACGSPAAQCLGM